MAKFTENLYKGILHEAKWKALQDNHDHNYNPKPLTYYIAKVAYEWALNGIVR